MFQAILWFKGKLEDSPKLMGIFWVWFFFSIFSLFFFMYLPNKKIGRSLLSITQKFSPLPLNASDASFRFFLVPHLFLEDFSVTTKDGKSFQFEEVSLYPGLPSFSPSFIPRAFLTLSSPSLDGWTTVGATGNSFSANGNVDLESLGILKEFGLPLNLAGHANLTWNAAGNLKAGPLAANGSISLKGRKVIMPPQSVPIPVGISSLMVKFPQIPMGSMDLSAELKNKKITIENLSIGDSKSPLQLKVTGTIEGKSPQPRAFFQRGTADLRVALKVDKKLSSRIKPNLYSYVSGLIPSGGSKEGDWIKIRVKGPLRSPKITADK